MMPMKSARSAFGRDSRHKKESTAATECGGAATRVAKNVDNTTSDPSGYAAAGGAPSDWLSSMNPALADVARGSAERTVMCSDSRNPSSNTKRTSAPSHATDTAAPCDSAGTAAVGMEPLRPEARRSQSAAVPSRWRTRSERATRCAHVTMQPGRSPPCTALPSQPSANAAKRATGTPRRSALLPWAPSDMATRVGDMTSSWIQNNPRKASRTDVAVLGTATKSGGPYSAGRASDATHSITPSAEQHVCSKARASRCCWNSPSTNCAMGASTLEVPVALPSNNRGVASSSKCTVAHCRACPSRENSNVREKNATRCTETAATLPAAAKSAHSCAIRSARRQSTTRRLPAPSYPSYVSTSALRGASNHAPTSVARSQRPAAAQPAGR
eukprot:Opistho-1_new@6484